MEDCFHSLTPMKSTGYMLEMVGGQHSFTVDNGVIYLWKQNTFGIFPSIAKE
ncbi:hypothetical protein MYP_867 [Sporocytophaga myxococcoides]|uniref:Uncharacterized protein n=1 Tax=Sporocytophaga myxococcoides TaxID=153721 RepID=A0A098L9N0_9BACT|nr:hypothetical protein MYP_867 [Sporocytophaga myxococcoides]